MIRFLWNVNYSILDFHDESKRAILRCESGTPRLIAHTNDSVQILEYINVSDGPVLITLPIDNHVAVSNLSPHDSILCNVTDAVGKRYVSLVFPFSYRWRSTTIVKPNIADNTGVILQISIGDLPVVLEGEMIRTPW